MQKATMEAEPTTWAGVHRRIRYASGFPIADPEIANLDETTGHWIKVSAKKSGFTVTNRRTGVTKARD